MTKKLYYFSDENQTKIDGKIVIILNEGVESADLTAFTQHENEDIQNIYFNTLTQQKLTKYWNGEIGNSEEGHSFMGLDSSGTPTDGWTDGVYKSWHYIGDLG